MSDINWIEDPSGWDTSTLLQYVPNAEHHIDELQRRLAYVQSILAARSDREV